ncbi:MAG TPA: hypothetical protein VLB79_11260 [Solirubrobacterales bacterium]|nr:hypothetical protein [Solirubrobacterales bacterium]
MRERELEGLDELLRLRVLDELLRPRVLPARELVLFVLFDLVDEPFRLVDLFELEPLRFVRPLEDRVVWAIVFASLLASSGFRASCAFRSGVT